MSDRPADDPPETADPAVIEYLVVTVEDVVTALEATLGTGRETVLRVTPPFSSRMRARLHVAGTAGSYDGPDPILVDPRVLVEPLPAYPTAADTAAELDSPAAVNTEQHQETHARRLAAWRDSVSASIADEATIETADGAVTVTVRALGSTADTDDEAAD